MSSKASQQFFIRHWLLMMLFKWLPPLLSYPCLIPKRGASQSKHSRQQGCNGLLLMAMAGKVIHISLLFWFISLQQLDIEPANDHLVLLDGNSMQAPRLCYKKIEHALTTQYTLCLRCELFPHKHCTVCHQFFSTLWSHCWCVYLCTGLMSSLLSFVTIVFSISSCYTTWV